MQTPEGERGFHSAEEEADSEGSQAEEPLDGLGRLMQQFDYERALRARGGRPSASSGVDYEAALPSRGGRSSASSGRPTGLPQSGRGDGLPAAGRDAPPWSQASMDPAMALQMQVQYEMLRQMRALGANAAGRDDAPDADDVDGPVFRVPSAE